MLFSDKNHVPSPYNTIDSKFLINEAGFLMIAVSFYDFYYSVYVGYGKLLIILLSLIISIIFIKLTKFKFKKHSTNSSLITIIILCIFITPIISQINTGFSIKHIKTVHAVVDSVQKKKIINPRSGYHYKYYIYINKDSAPDINSKILCKKRHSGNYAELNYQRGLFGIQFVTLTE